MGILNSSSSPNVRFDAEKMFSRAMRGHTFLLVQYWRIYYSQTVSNYSHFLPWASVAAPLPTGGREISVDSSRV